MFRLFTYASGGISRLSQGEGPASVSYGQLTAATSSQPVALSIFALTQNGTLVTEAGVPAVSPVSKARLFVDLAEGINSGVAIVNPGSSALTISVELRDQSGATVSSSSLTVPPKGHVSRFVNELGLNFSVPFLGTLSLSAASPFAAVNLRTATNGYGEPLFSALPVANLDSPPTGSSSIFSQVADGGGIPTQILLMNPSATTAIAGTLTLLDDNGSDLALDFGPDTGVQSRIDYSIPPNGMAKFVTTGAGQPRAGYAVVTSSSGPLPVGSVVFSINGTAGLASQAGVLNAPQTTGARLFAEVSSSPLARNTGIAIVNANGTAVTVTLNLAGFDGTNRSATLTIGPRGHVAKFLTELISGALPPELQGILTLTSSLPIAPLTLRLTTNQRGEPILSTLPAADLNNPPIGPLFLPQIVDGGGFQTQLILINTSGDPGTIHVDFFKDDGAKVPSPIR